MRGGSGRNFGVVFLALVLGAIIGGIIGELIAGSALGVAAPFLIKTFPIFDLTPVAVNLYVIKFVFGISFHPNLISIIGMMLAFLIVEHW